LNLGVSKVCLKVHMPEFVYTTSGNSRMAVDVDSMARIIGGIW